MGGNVLANPITMVVFILYVVGLFGITVWSSKSVKSQSDFLVGGRNIGWLGTALSACASSNSAGTMIGHAGSAYLIGLQFHWVSFGIVLFESLNMFLLMAPRMRNIAGHRDILTIPDYYRVRFKSISKVVQAVAALIIVSFMISYLIAQFKGMTFTIQNVLGWDFTTGVIVSALIVTVYTFVGGYVAVVWTDVIQGMLMFCAMLFVPIAVIVKSTSMVGGFSGQMATLQALDPNMVVPLSGAVFLSCLGTFCSDMGSTGNPHIITRYISVKDKEETRKAGLTTVIFGSVVTYGAVIVGLFGRILIPDVNTLANANPEMIYFEMTRQLVPSQILVGLIYAGIFAAIMSTIDSMLLVVSSTVVRDLWQNIIKKGAEVETKTMLNINRATVVVVCLIAMIGTFFAPASIFVLGLFAWTGVGCSIGPPIVLSLWWKRANGYGALAGMIGGVVMACLFQFVPTLSSIMYGCLPAFLTSLILCIVVSLLTPAENDPDLEHDLTVVPQDSISGEAII